MALSKEIIQKVINYCNRDLVPDKQYITKKKGVLFPSEWFESYFSFLNNKLLEKNLGEAFYQARFLYKIMSALNLPFAKHKAFLRFQIIQYASICEAILESVIERFYKNEFQNKYAINEYAVCKNATSKETKILFEGKPLYLCKIKKKKADIKRERIDHKTEFAVEHGIISPESKKQFDQLYDSRNNIHILKAINNNYRPQVKEAKNAFKIMQRFASEVKSYYIKHNIN